METVTRCAALALCTGAVCLLIKKTNPELALIASAAAVTVITAAVLRTGSALRELFIMGKTLAGDSGMYITPLLKCAGIGIICSVSSGLCRDASQNALGAAVELAGTVSVLAISVPTLMTMLKLIGDIV